MFPISLWVPQEYPRLAPITFVTPTKDMAVRAGQYRSNLLAFFSVLQDVFAREPPVVSRQEPAQRRHDVQQQNTSIPPPVPPLPPELGRPEMPSVEAKPNSQPQIPPPVPPPPPGWRPETSSSGVQGRLPQTNGAPPVPPHPGRQGSHNQTIVHQSSAAHDRQMPIPQHPHRQPPTIHDSRGRDGPPMDNRLQQNPKYLPVRHSESPVSPITPTPDQSFPEHVAQIPQNVQKYRGPPQPPLPTPSQDPRSPGLQQYPGYYQPPQTPYQQPLQQAQPKPKPQVDLLTSPFENPLPAPSTEIAPPPIPPNPHKDALLGTLSQTLTQQVRSTHESNMAAIPPLRAQQAALNETLNKINREISQLSDLQALLDSNEKILHQAMVDADKVLEDAKRREVPAVEEVLVAPTVVAGQLYECVVEERVLEECRAVVGKALDKGRIGGDVWAKVRKT
ncbi:MAG: hypothetical protein Q9183_001886 [Haloplaca sp. 2 TL-2023]